MNDEEALARLKVVELSILEAISELCEENGITWWLDGGTCLGALRHRGFIPWDDDIDIGMLRPDYDRFCELAQEKLPQGFSFHTSRNTAGYSPMFAKVYKDGTRFENQESRESGSAMGIFVDVFPYDLLYEDPKLSARQIRLAYNAQRRSYLFHSKSIVVPHKGILGVIERAGCRVLHVAEKSLARNIGAYQDQFDRAIPNPIAGEVSNRCLTLAWPNMEPVPVDEILPTSLALFEGKQYPVPRLTEKYLTTMYGDWKVIPAPEDRHTHLPLLIDFGNEEVWESNG